jgi:predicted nicotinamide N-methyase
MTRTSLQPDFARPLGAFGGRLELRTPPLCPELELWLMSDDVDLEAGCNELRDGEPPPFWAFCWGSGQALARFVLDHPQVVLGRRVVDLGCGSGIAGLAAALAGARDVLAVDLDPHALRAAQLNAAHNGLRIEASHEPPEEWDLMLAADVLYETGLREWILSVGRHRGPILLADPQRTGTPQVDFAELARVAAVTLPDVDSPQKNVVIYDLPSED